MRLAIAILVPLVLVPASVAATPLVPGTYVTKVKVGAADNTAAMVGTWHVVITSSGRYVAYNGTSEVATGGAGQITFAPFQRVTFTDRSGPHACHGSAAVGVYHWTYIYRYGHPSLLLLRPIRDTCPGRRAVFSNGLKLVKVR
jgi:hypothetical protein